MKRMLWVGLFLAAGCASSKGGSAPAGTGSEYASPIVMYHVEGRNGPSPVVRIPYDTAREMGVIAPTPATPSLIDQLEASCAQSNQEVQCRHELEPCHFKTCRIVPVR